MGMENPLLLMGGDFEFYCLQLKNPVGIPKILMLFPVGMRVQCSFPMEIPSCSNLTAQTIKRKESL